MPGIFSVTGNNINSLSDEDCVELFGELLHANARQLKIPISKVSFTWETRADAGIDASVEDVISEEGDLIVDSETFYQIKSGVSFKRNDAINQPDEQDRPKRNADDIGCESRQSCGIGAQRAITRYQNKPNDNNDEHQITG